MRFLNPDFLWNFLWILPLTAGVFIHAWKKRSKTLQLLDAAGGKNIRLILSKKGRVWRFLFFELAVIFLVITCARPSFGEKIQEIEAKGRDLLVVFDTSKSMLCKDVQPSRLEHAKWLMREIVKANPGDRFGLVAFAGKAFLECPMTADTSSLLQSIRELNVESIPVGGTNIEEALTQASRAFQAAETPNRAVILITDGDELEGDCAKVIREFAGKKIPLFVVGIGDPSQPSIVQVPDGKGGVVTLKDEKGDFVSSPLNEKALSALASETGGIYIRSTGANSNFKALQSRISGLVPESLAAFKMTKPIERFMYPLVCAILFFTLFLLTGERPFGQKKVLSGKSALVFLLVFLLVSGGNAAEKPQTAKPVSREPSPVESYNAGVDFQSKGDEKNALASYGKVLSHAESGKELTGKASQNTGVVLHTSVRKQEKNAMDQLTAQKLDEAEKTLRSTLPVMEKIQEYYKEAMRADPESAASADQSILLADQKRIRELLKKIEELKKQQQKARQQTKQARDQQKQDQKQNQNQQKQDRKQNQNQQKQDQQKQDQGAQSASEKTQQAKNEVQKLKDQASGLGQKKLEESAKKAEQEIDKALKAQEKNKQDQAQKHLENAVRELGEDPKQDRKQKQDQQKQDQQKQDQKKDGRKDPQSGDRPLPGPEEKNVPKQQKGAPGKENKENKIDRNQAEAILNGMRGDEKNLRDELRARSREQYKNTPVRKDW